jgi:Ca-activated chloride channel family protein
MSRDIGEADSDFRFASSVAAFGMVLRDSPYKGGSTLKMAEKLASDARGEDEKGYRQEFIDMMKEAKKLK